MGREDGKARLGACEGTMCEWSGCLRENGAVSVPANKEREESGR